MARASAEFCVARRIQYLLLKARRCWCTLGGESDEGVFARNLAHSRECGCATNNSSAVCSFMLLRGPVRRGSSERKALRGEGGRGRQLQRQRRRSRRDAGATAAQRT